MFIGDVKNKFLQSGCSSRESWLFNHSGAADANVPEGVEPVQPMGGDIFLLRS